MQHRSAPKRHPEHLTREEVGSICEVDERRERRYPTVLRNRVLIHIGLYRCGLRISEALNLRRRDIKWSERRLAVVQGKGAKDRSIRLSDNSIAQLGKWDVCRKTGATFFNSLDGSVLSPRYVQQMVKRLAERGGIEDPGRVTPHVFRHSRATHMREEDVPFEQVQEFLGHADPRTTMVYDHIVQGQMEQEVERLDEALP